MQTQLTNKQHELVYLALCDYYEQAEAEGAVDIARQVNRIQRILNNQWQEGRTS